MVTAVVFVALSLVAWNWQQTMRARQPPSVVAERWEHVQELFPTPEPLKPPSETDPETLQKALQANPFSRQRRHVPKPAEEAGATPQQPLPPQFVFKGRVVMGTKQRGILEDRQQKKTFFVQAGQEVVGFQVVEITEDQVVLLKLDTKEEVRLPLASKATTERRREN